MDSISALGVIYVILNTQNNKVYIGQSINLRKRWRNHKTSLRRGDHPNRHLQAAWNKYGEKSFKFKKLEYCLIEEIDAREQHYLDIYMPRGMCYNNAIDAKVPARGLSPSAETRRKLSEAGKGHIVSAETRRKLSEATKNSSPELVRKRADARKGFKFTEESRRKMSESQKKRPPISDETREKLSKAALGKKRGPMSDEQRQKLSEAGKRRVYEPFTDDHKRKIGEGIKRHYAELKDKPLDEE